MIAIEKGTVQPECSSRSRHPKGTIAVSGTAGQKLDITAKLNALPASPGQCLRTGASARKGQSAAPSMSSGTAAAPVVAYNLEWSGASLAAARTAGVGAFDISANGKFANNRVTLDTTLSGAGGLAFKGGGNVDIGGNMPIAMKFNGNVPFALVANLMAQQGFTLTGQASVDLSISGSAKAPQIAGTITTSGGRLVDVRRNLALNNLTANVALDGKQATISKLSANLATGGSVEVTGTVGTVPSSGFPANLIIRLNNATYVDGTLFTAQLAGEMTLTGPLVATPTLGGKVTIRKAAITIPEKLPTSLSAIDIKHKNAPAKVKRMARGHPQGREAGRRQCQRRHRLQPWRHGQSGLRARPRHRCRTRRRPDDPRHGRAADHFGRFRDAPRPFGNPRQTPRPLPMAPSASVAT